MSGSPKRDPQNLRKKKNQPPNIVEQSLRELLALSAHDAWSSLVSRQLRRPRRSDRRRRL
jgi:hypothetical protein